MHLMVSSRVVDAKVFTMVIQFEYGFLIRQNGERNFRNFRRVLFGIMSSDVTAFNVHVFTSDFEF